MTDKTKSTEPEEEVKVEKAKRLENYSPVLDPTKRDAQRNYLRFLRNQEEELEDKLAEKGMTLDEYYADKPAIPRVKTLQDKLGKKG
jgi:hypothetical protein